MSAKNCDHHNRWRNITVGFRVSPEENERLNRAVALSGLPKQEYCYRKCRDNSITVTPNPRIFKAMKTALDDVWTELKRISAGTQPSDELMNDITLIAKMLNDMKVTSKGKQTTSPRGRSTATVLFLLETSIATAFIESLLY